MKRTISIAFAILLVSFTSFMPGSGQDQSALQSAAPVTFVWRCLPPTKSSPEMETIPGRNEDLAACELPTDLRTAASVPLVTSGYAADLRERYAYILSARPESNLINGRRRPALVCSGWGGSGPQCANPLSRRPRLHWSGHQPNHHAARSALASSGRVEDQPREDLQLRLGRRRSGALSVKVLC